MRIADCGKRGGCAVSDVRQQEDIAALLEGAFPVIEVIAEERGPTEADVDSALSGRLAKGGKSKGMVLIVGMPSEKVAKKAAQAVTFEREFVVRVIEHVKTNRPPGQALATGFDYSTLKKAVVDLLHARGISGGTLAFAGTVPFADDKGGVGFSISFTLEGGYLVPTRANVPLITIAAGVCTLDGGGDVVRFSTGGSCPLTGAVYSAPFAVASGDLVRACCTRSGVQPGSFVEEVAP